MENDKSCKTCHWHQFEWIDQGNVCVNGKSDYCTEWTDDDEYCKYYESEAGDR